MQLLALYAHIKRGEFEAVAAIRLKLEAVKRIRDLYCQSQPVPVDDLIEKIVTALGSFKAYRCPGPHQ